MIDKTTMIEELKEKLQSLSTIQEVQNIKAQYFGKKGQITALMKNIGRIEPEKKKEYGMQVNELKQEIERLLNGKLDEIKKEIKKQEELKNWVDVTAHGAERSFGKEHLIAKTIRDIYEIFTQFGFTVVEGPEIEEPWFNFDALNTPEWHPAREMQDTFYLEDDLLLRTHTSAVQIRTMLKEEPPLAIISSGRTYRKDEIDATHSAMFHQLECLFIDKKVTVGNLKMFLEQLTKKIFDNEDTKVLLRPSYFPFVEPGFEVDVSCMNCGGKGCNVCKGTGWIEVLGAGLVHPKVLENVGYDPEKWQGFAFGVGVERIAMLKYGISNMRELYKNDIRFID
ncbi:phenylalanine--tRNA ligase alpha subunit [Tepiditoga spiralis]|uniref:Phenylalanine--tRNA ligase alpha subunit n=1 Tax=Tepiditoga spiralis TaxID=2108365 RepID=A0A7G1G9T6_9BACT|nr:phenylalanine--tRNA ligase subunit alpha [Tepiditoga spiralis]BBE30099.1 phenylalanine--tRNA ligase alpha subunit [Tepiditoga spiralis]